MMIRITYMYRQLVVTACAWNVGPVVPITAIPQNIGTLSDVNVLLMGVLVPTKYN